MIPEIRGVAFALALLTPQPTAYLCEGRTSSVVPSSPDSVSGADDETHLHEQLGVPLALFLELRAVGVLRTTRGARPEVRNVERRSR